MVICLNVEDEVYYTLRFATAYDEYTVQGYQTATEDSPVVLPPAGNCGTPGRRAGLVATFSETDLRRIPYGGSMVEIPFSVLAGVNSINLCNKFKNFGVQLIATCEIPTSTSQVYQYNVH